MAGATVIESPVCIPIGSKFSIEHIIMMLLLIEDRLKGGQGSEEMMRRLENNEKT
jgi:hypothetical protein